jgi:hypothetical protein
MKADELQRRLTAWHAAMASRDAVAELGEFFGRVLAGETAAGVVGRRGRAAEGRA